MKTTSTIKRCLYLKLILIASTVLMFSCKGYEAIPYKPAVKLQESPFSFNGKVVVKDFKDLRNKKDTSTTQIIFNSVTHLPNFYGKLSEEIEKAIITDFSNNKVFSEIGKDSTDADYVLVGEIRNFKGRSYLNTYGVISAATLVGTLTWYFGMPIHKYKIDIDLKVSIYDNKSGNLLGEYVGNTSKTTHKSMYRTFKFRKTLPSKTNESFSNAIMQIREQIAKDISKYN